MKPTNEQKNRLKKIFEPRYGRSLSEAELEEIHINLMQWAEVLLEIADSAVRSNIETSKQENPKPTIERD